MADLGWWLLALIVCAAPRRLWDRIDPRFPLRRAATAAGVLTLAGGFFFGVDQFLTFGGGLADANNTWMLNQLSKPAGPNDAQVGFVPYGISVVTLFIFLFFTPAGLASMYLVITGAARAISAVVDDPRGDPLISLAHWIATTAWTRNRDDRKKMARERQEGADAPDVLRTGEWAELHGFDWTFGDSSSFFPPRRRSAAARRRPPTVFFFSPSPFGSAGPSAFAFGSNSLPTSSTCATSALSPLRKPRRSRRV